MKKAFRIFEKHEKIASRFLKNKDNTRKLFKKLSYILSNKYLVFAEFKEYLETMVRLVKSFIKGEYRLISYSRIILIVAAMLYIINPLDAISDLLPLIGFTDDLMILGWVILQVKGEIYKYMEWETAKI